MNKTSWVEKKKIEQVLIYVRENRDIIRRLFKKKMKLIGLLFRYNTFVRNIFEGKILGKRSRGRPRTSYFQDLKHLLDVTSYSQLRNVANDRDIWPSPQGTVSRWWWWWWWWSSMWPSCTSTEYIIYSVLIIDNTIDISVDNT